MLLMIKKPAGELLHYLKISGSLIVGSKYNTLCAMLDQCDPDELVFISDELYGILHGEDD